MPDESKDSTPKRRLPAIERPISEISSDKDVRVRILGTVLEMTDSSLLMDDGTGKVEVMFDVPEAMAGVMKSQLIRVVARVLPLIDGYVLKGECVQMLEGFDVNLYKRARQICV
ncbi:MAG: hypothetical protein ACE5J7_03220 [Candidatus Aenigmatarchaeota archaeon]